MLGVIIVIGNVSYGESRITQLWFLTSEFLTPNFVLWKIYLYCMHLTILNRKTLDEIPSASGIEIIGDKLFIMGDDSPWLFKLDDRFEIEGKIQITDILPDSGNKIAKALKPDLEAMAFIELNGHNELFLFGSGSKSPERDVLIRVNVDHLHAVKKHSLVEFYKNLRNALGLTKDEINIEAAAVLSKILYLFNRGKNKVVRVNMNDFISYLEGNEAIPSFEFFSVKLPALNGREAGFSGATCIPDSQQIIFTASIENTPNWIDDGEILGSFLGTFSVTTLKNSFAPDCIVIKDDRNNTSKIKVESVAVRRRISADCFQLCLVTDNDSATSEIIEAELKL